MKKILMFLASLAIGSTSFVSCTDLSEETYSVIPSDEFFNNEEEFLMSAGRIYAYLVRYTCYRCIWGTITVSTDEGVSPLREGNQWVDDGVWRDMHAHTWTPDMQDLETIWEFLFGGISLCNQILYEFDQSSLDFPEKESLIAEVIVMRAWFYLNAMDLFGNVPFTIDFADTSLPEQVDRKYLYTFIEREILDHVDLLEDVPTSENYGRVTKAMAYTVLAKLYINAEEWIGEPKWQETIDVCDKVIGYGKLQIEPDYFTNFKVDNTGSRENIFVILYDKVYTSQDWWHVFRFHQLTLNSLSQETFILDDVKRILAQPFECRKTSLPDGALHNVQKELENMINAIDKDIYSFTPSYGKYLIDCWLGDELVDKLLDVSCQYEKLIKLK